MLHRILWAALVAGIVAGLATAVLQHFTTTPLILEAEAYENGGPETAALQAGLLVLAHVHGDHAEGAAESWAPADG
ncbi:MAG TPA: CbtA family protein, partial [Kiloniellaceae bacterium]|nr:CbtA family protein [Kiloniellaceae bacterium]